MSEVYYLKMTDHEGRRPRMVKVDPRAMTAARVRNERNVDAVAIAEAIVAAETTNEPEYVTCSVCEKLVPTDPRGDVLDSSGRCDECRP